MRRAFTLIELMLVMALIGLLGTISVGGYRAMRSGMEERGVMQNVNQFVRNAYQRAMIDRQPTAIYCWNETLREESDDSTQPMQVVGHAVAVRRAGRVTRVADGCIVDEFGDLKFYMGRDLDGEEDEDEAKDGVRMNIYKINGDGSFKRYSASQATMRVDAQSVMPMMTADLEWMEKNGEKLNVTAYGYYLDGGTGDWKPGDAYGFEIADLTLPNNFIFGSDFSKTVKNPIRTLNKTPIFNAESGGDDGKGIVVSAIRPKAKSGEPEAQRIGETESAKKD